MVTRQIRQAVFETNSSSTHSLTMCSKNEFDAWRNGETFFDVYGGKFVTRDDIIAAVNEVDLSTLSVTEFLDFLAEDGDYETYDQYFDNELEEFEKSYTSPSGDVVIAFGKYGSDY